MKKGTIFFLAILIALTSCEQNQEANEEFEKHEIPAMLTNLQYDSQGRLVFEHPENGKKYMQAADNAIYTIDKLSSEPIGTDSGLAFDFRIPQLNGTLFYGFILQNANRKQPVYFKRTSEIRAGKTEVNIIKNLSGKYDIADWEEKGRFVFGYRVADESGRLIYDGKVNVSGKDPFNVDLSIIEGPFLNMLTDESAVISFRTNRSAVCRIFADGRTFEDAEAATNHEIAIDNLSPEKKYDYKIEFGENVFESALTTAPKPGTRKPLVFGFASDSRGGTGGGERDIFGVNAYIMKKIAALCAYKDVAFFQFTGDLIDGYLYNFDEQLLQYSNWKRAIEPFAHDIPFNIAFGNHESLNYILMAGDEEGPVFDRFPYKRFSAEEAFAQIVTNPMNGPESEDGSSYDPNPDKMDFPSYKENVFYYIYDNIAMVALNSDYWYTPSKELIPHIGGNLHGYIMDRQLQWLENTILMLEKDETVDHIFITLHTPVFPNGGHAKDDMWYYGNNEKRPWINGKKADQGIIERRDAILEILVNKSSKALAILTGDEHNYSRMKISAETEIYPDDWQGERIDISRPIWHITNGSAGAPYYGQEELPWSSSVELFSTKYALVLFRVDGKKVDIEVIDPDNLEPIEEASLR